MYVPRTLTSGLALAFSFARGERRMVNISVIIVMSSIQHQISDPNLHACGRNLHPVESNSEENVCTLSTALEIKLRSIEALQGLQLSCAVKAFWACVEGEDLCLFYIFGADLYLYIMYIHDFFSVSSMFMIHYAQSSGSRIPRFLLPMDCIISCRHLPEATAPYFHLEREVGRAFRLRHG